MMAEEQLPDADVRGGSIPRSRSLDCEADAPIVAETLDDALKHHLGEFGRGQQRILLFSSLSWSSLALVVLSMVFVSQDPVAGGQWQCIDPHDSACIAVKQASGQGFCELQQQQWEWTQPDNSLAATFQLTCGQAWKQGAANAVFFIGYWFGSLIFGYISDNHGRRLCLILANLATAAAAGGAALSSTFPAYAVMRTLAGMSCSGLPIAAYILSTEAVGSSWRGRAGILSQVIYHVGELALPLAAWLLQNWRLLNLAVATCCMLTAMLAVGMPESPRWLLVSGRSDEAHQVLQWLAAANGRQWPEGLHVVADCSGSLSKIAVAAHGETTTCNGTHKGPGSNEQSEDPLQQHVQQQQQQQQDVQRQAHKAQQHAVAAAADGPMSPESPESSNKREQARAWWLLVSHARMRHYFVATSLMMLAMATGFYVLSLAADSLHGSIYLNFFLTSLAEVPAAGLGLLAVDTPQLGRRRTVLLGLIITSMGCVGCGLMQPSRLQVALATLGKGACSGAWTVAYIYAAELFPVTIRSCAMGGTNQASRLGGVLAPAIMLFASSRPSRQGLPFLAIGLLSLAAAALVGPLPETRGTEPPDTVQGSDAAFRQRKSAADNRPDAVKTQPNKADRLPLLRKPSLSWRLPGSYGQQGRWKALPSDEHAVDVECSIVRICCGPDNKARATGEGVGGSAEHEELGLPARSRDDML